MNYSHVHAQDAKGCSIRTSIPQVYLTDYSKHGRTHGRRNQLSPGSKFTAAGFLKLKSVQAQTISLARAIQNTLNAEDSKMMTQQLNGTTPLRSKQISALNTTDLSATTKTDLYALATHNAKTTTCRKQGAKRSRFERWSDVALLEKRWADVCIEAEEFSLSSKLLPVGSLNFFRTLAVVDPAQDFGYRRPTVTTWGWSQLCTAFLKYSLFGGLQTVNFSIFRSAFVSVRPILGAASIFDTVVQIAPVSVSTAIVFDPDVQIDDIQHSDSSSRSSSISEKLDFYVSSPTDEETSADQLDFSVATPAVRITSAPSQISLPPPADPIYLPTASLTSISEYFDDLGASISRIIDNKTKDSRMMGDSQSEVMSKINHLERALLDALSQQNLAFRSLIQSVRQEAHNQSDVLSIGLKVVRAQTAILSTYLAYVRTEVKAQKAELFEEMDERLATIRSEFLDFRAQAQENHLNLSTQKWGRW
ncbi:nuclear matrix constituent protein 1-like protein [Dorcoceras hygrometricum]|uniref:Nuclear matrix constituent protein 1-like protein n=1 Tax=Dorcoceras hygrometricum TaxID=472368 RepID=A0A2Z7C8H1_9LAMI|nr:nuclear matrix constituent protein 1-like protein [Dorcoceras hygrometricum]